MLSPVPPSASHLAMPNGGGPTFRIGARDPSPVHTSDSEEAFEHKMRWRELGLWVAAHWRMFVARRRRERRVAMMSSTLLHLRLLPHGLPEVVLLRLAGFLC